LHVEGWLATNGVMGLGRANNSGLLLFGVASTEEKLLKAISNLETEVNEPLPKPLLFSATRSFASREKSVRDMSRTTTACTRDSSISRRACNPRAAEA